MRAEFGNPRPLRDSDVTGSVAPGATLALARDILRLRPDTAGAARAADLLIDHLGVAVAGAGRPWVAALHGWAGRRARPGKCVVLGTAAKVSADAAAFVNAVAGHSFELDDTHDASMSHPGAVIFPTALALAAEHPAQGGEVLAAVAAGYETMARLGRAARAEEVIARGFHPTALFGVFGAAAAAARMMRFTPEQLVAAWGHSLSLAGGSMQFSQEPRGADVKRMHAGYAARAGLLAADMAAYGIGAPEQVLDGRYGLSVLFGAGGWEPEALSGRGRLALHEVSIKPYACNRLLHAVIDGLRELTDFNLPRETVVHLTVRGPRKLRDQHMVRRPASVMAAQYSLPFTVGATMVLGEGAIAAYEPDQLGREDILAWADLVEVQEDPELEALYPERFAAAVDLQTACGAERSITVLDSRGTPAKPMDRAAIRAKAMGLMGRRALAASFEVLADAAADLPGADDAGALLRAMSWIGEGV